jgi:hypothetical protein
MPAKPRLDEVGAAGQKIRESSRGKDKYSIAGFSKEYLLIVAILKTRLLII